MLRLQPSEILISQREVADLKQRLDLRHAMKDLKIVRPQTRVKGKRPAKAAHEDILKVLPNSATFDGDGTRDARDRTATKTSPARKSNLDDPYRRSAFGEDISINEDPEATDHDHDTSEYPVVPLVRMPGPSSIDPAHGRSQQQHVHFAHGTRSGDSAFSSEVEPFPPLTEVMSEEQRSRFRRFFGHGGQDLETLSTYTNPFLATRLSADTGTGHHTESAAHRILQLPSIRALLTGSDPSQQVVVKRREVSSSNSGLSGSTYDMSEYNSNGNDSDASSDKENDNGQTELNEDQTVLIRPMPTPQRNNSSASRNQSSHDWAIAPGGRPRSNGNQRPVLGSMRRRLVVSEQENDDEMVEYEQERLMYLARQRRSEPLERTPPRAGRLERFL